MIHVSDELDVIATLAARMYDDPITVTVVCDPVRPVNPHGVCIKVADDGGSDTYWGPTLADAVERAVCDVVEQSVEAHA